jgi:uroporphyrinogen decarboxylase
MEKKALDRPPFDYWTEDISRARLLEYLELDDIDVFLDEVGIDIRGVNAIELPEQSLGEGLFQNFWGERYVYYSFPMGKQRQDLPGALVEATSLQEIKDFPWPKNDDLDYSKLCVQCEDIRSRGCAVRYGNADIFERPMLVRGLENAFVDFYENPEYISYLCRIFTDFYLEDYRRAWESSAGKIDMFVIYSDVGSQGGPLISKDMYNKFFAPYLSEMIALIHSFGARLLFHSCGEVSSFIPDFIRIGVDILDPIQPVNGNMSPENLAQYKNEICFHGGIDLQKFLVHATTEQVWEKAHRYFELLGPSYILGPTHFFQPDTPPENIVALYRAFSS